ncbi:MAG: type III-B CRISPR module RAMP protein Cmr1 [candidate division WOR-3 bacterium]
MKILKLKCKLITPMFMAGADGKTPELRPSEFKGMMRWWWRAVKAEDNIEKLKREEAEIFGGTGEGEGKSKVQLKIKGISSLNIGNNLKVDYNLHWCFDRNTNSLAGENAGIGYLLYSTVLPNRERSYIKDGYEFELTLTFMNEEAFKKACASLWLAIYLGGFGTRARRGGGNIEVTQVDENNDINLDFICDAKDTSQLKKFLERNLTEIKKICGTNTSYAQLEYTNLKDARILIFDPKNDWKEALNFLGEEYRKFRNNNKSQIFETATFGMPIMHSGFSTRMVPYDNNKERLSERWASFLIFKVIKSSNNLYFPVIVKLSPGGVNYIGMEEKRDNKWNKSNVKKFTEKLVNNFLNGLPKREELIL